MVRNEHASSKVDELNARNSGVCIRKLSDSRVLSCITVLALVALKKLLTSFHVSW